LDDGRLRTQFETYWPRIAEELDRIPRTEAKQPERDPAEIQTGILKALAEIRSDVATMGDGLNYNLTLVLAVLRDTVLARAFPASPLRGQRRGTLSDALELERSQNRLVSLMDALEMERIRSRVSSEGLKIPEISRDKDDDKDDKDADGR
jgi:hypothetical protein